MNADTILNNVTARLESIVYEQQDVLSQLTSYKKQVEQLKDTVDNIGGIDMDFPAAASEQDRLLKLINVEIKKSNDLAAEQKAAQALVDLLKAQKEAAK